MNLKGETPLFSLRLPIYILPILSYNITVLKSKEVTQMTNISGNKISRAFQKDYQAAQRSKSIESKTLAVVRIKKNGQPGSTKMVDPQFNYFTDMEKATQRARALEKMNPGNKYTVVEL